MLSMLAFVTYVVKIGVGLTLSVPDMQFRVPPLQLHVLQGRLDQLTFTQAALKQGPQHRVVVEMIPSLGFKQEGFVLLLIGEGGLRVGVPGLMMPALIVTS